MTQKEKRIVLMALLALSLTATFTLAILAEAQEKRETIELRMATGAKPQQRFYQSRREMDDSCRPKDQRYGQGEGFS